MQVSMMTSLLKMGNEMDIFLYLGTATALVVGCVTAFYYLVRWVLSHFPDGDENGETHEPNDVP